MMCSVSPAANGASRGQVASRRPRESEQFNDCRAYAWEWIPMPSMPELIANAERALAAAKSRARVLRDVARENGPGDAAARMDSADAELRAAELGRRVAELREQWRVDQWVSDVQHGRAAVDPALLALYGGYGSRDLDVEGLARAHFAASV